MFPARSEQLKGEAAELRERIKHLNDMVFSQQRKVKAMIEEVRIYKDFLLFIKSIPCTQNKPKPNTIELLCIV